MRTIKTLGIATAMALALISIAGAGMASANNFKAAAEPESWSGALSGANHKLILGEWSPPFICSGVAFSGETKAKTLSDLTVTPQLSGCAHISGASTAWEMNGCKFRFNPGPGPALVGTMDIVGCVKPMRYELGSGWGICSMEIGNQNGLGTVTYENISVGGVPAVKVIANLSGITYTNNEGACDGSTNGTFSNGKYGGEWIVKGATVPGGVAAAAEIQSTSLSYSRFSAERGPATLSGATGSTLKLSFSTGIPETVNGVVYCESTTYSGTASLVPTEAISLAPSFHNCWVHSYNAEGKEIVAVIEDKDITAGGCSYQLQAKGGFAIVGATCASSPIKITTPGCVLKLGPQSGFPGPSFSNKGAGTLRTVTVSTNVNTKGLTYTAEGASCMLAGTMTGASPKPAVVLSAKDAAGAAQGLWVE